MEVLGFLVWVGRAVTRRDMHTPHTHTPRATLCTFRYSLKSYLLGPLGVFPLKTTMSLSGRVSGLIYTEGASV